MVSGNHPLSGTYMTQPTVCFNALSFLRPMVRWIQFRDEDIPVKLDELTMRQEMKLENGAPVYYVDMGEGVGDAEVPRNQGPSPDPRISAKAKSAPKARPQMKGEPKPKATAKKAAAKKRAQSQDQRATPKKKAAKAKASKKKDAKQELNMSYNHVYSRVYRQELRKDRSLEEAGCSSKLQYLVVMLYKHIPTLCPLFCQAQNP